MRTRNATAQVAAPSPARIAAQELPSPVLVFPGEASLKTLQNASGLLSRAWRWFRARQLGRSSSKRLQVAATVSLGEKRFVAVIQVDGLQFLVGGGPTNVALLAQLNGNGSFGEVLQESMTASKKQSAKRVRQQIAKPVTGQMGDQA
ncbi:MAG: flagellar biosynthetic protein FliO [Terracidiphilus sp.]|jgi:hypothetical protein